MNMVRKLSARNRSSTIALLAIFWGLAVSFLMLYISHTPALTRDSFSLETLEEGIENFYGILILVSIFVLIGVFFLARYCTNPIGKRVNRYLAEHSEVTLELLDEDFAGAKQFGGIWVGKKYTYVPRLNRLLLENDRIVLVRYKISEAENETTYWICWCMVDGKEYRVPITLRWLWSLQEYYCAFDHIITENNPKYDRMFKHDLNQLLDIKYNKHMRH